MALQNRTQLSKTLVAIFDQVAPVLASVEYRLIGTAGSLLHGVHLTTNDIDFLFRDRNAVDELGGVMQPHFRCLVAPTYLSDDQQYFASYEVNGVEVEISTVEWKTDSDGIECIGSGPWNHFEWLSIGEYSVPTITLELRLATELARKRADRYDPILLHMQQRGCNIKLLMQCMEANGLSAEIQDDIKQQLGS